MSDPGPNGGSGNQGPGSQEPGTGATGEFTLSDQYAKDPAIVSKGFKSADDLAKSYIELERKMGNSVQIPGENATDEQRREFFRKIGHEVPSSPEEYALDRPENLPEGFVYNEALEGAMRKLAHNVGVSQKQLAAIFDGYNAFMLQNHENLTKKGNEQFANAWNKMRQEWGENFAANREKSLRFAARIGGNDLVDFFKAHPEVGNNPIIIKAMYQGGQLISEGALPTGEPGGGQEPAPGEGGFRLQYNTPMGPEKDQRR